MSGSQTGKVAIVTGGSAGMGRLFAGSLPGQAFPAADIDLTLIRSAVAERPPMQP